MITAETPPTGGAPRGVHGRSSRKRAKAAFQVKAVVPAFLLAAVFIFTGAPTATAAVVFAHNMTTSTTSWDPLPCRGTNPGICPYHQQSDQPDRQIMETQTKDRPSTGQSGEQSTTSESSTP